MASELEVGGLTVSGSGHDAATISVTNAGSNNARLLLNSGHGNWSVCNSDTIGDALEFRDETANATRLAIDSSGRVGVSVTPGAKLHVSSGTTNNLGDDVSEVRFIGPDKAITGEQANVVIQTNDDFAVDKGGSIGLGGRHTTSSTNGANFAQISGRKENATTANFAGYLAFSTSDAASDIHERMRIDASGNLTLGTPAAGSAAAMFHISGAAPRIRLEDTSAPENYSQIAADNGQLTLAADGGGGQGSSAIIAQVDGGEKMRLDSSGNLNVNGGGYVKIGPTDATADFRLYRNDSSIADGNAIGDVKFGGADASNDAAARIRAKADGGDWTATSSPTALEFATCPVGSETLATRLTVSSDGNIEQHTDSNGIVKFGVKNESTGTAARAMVNILSDHGNLDLSMNGTNYTGVAGWADSGVVSTGSVVSGGLKMNAVAGGLALQTNQTTRVSIANSSGLATFSAGIKNEQGIYGGQITIADDAVGTITPPRQGVMMAISYGNDSAYPAHQNMAGLIWCDTGSSLTCAKLTSEGSSLSVGTSDLTVAAGVDGNINIAAISGTIQIKNRVNSTIIIWYNFIA